MTLLKGNSFLFIVAFSEEAMGAFPQRSLGCDSKVCGDIIHLGRVTEQLMVPDSCQPTSVTSVALLSPSVSLWPCREHPRVVEGVPCRHQQNRIIGSKEE